MTTVKEVEYFIGALITMGIAPRDSLDDYFTICPFYGVSVKRERISRDRFRLLSKDCYANFILKNQYFIQIKYR